MLATGVADDVRRVFSRDPVVEAAPLTTVEGVEKSARGIRPCRGTGGADAVGGVAIVGSSRGIIVRIASEVLLRTVCEQLVDDHAHGDGGFPDRAGMGRPRQTRQRVPAGERDRLTRGGTVGHRIRRRARIRSGELNGI